MLARECSGHLDEYTSANVTALTVYLSFDNPHKSFINGAHLRRFIDGFPNLRRLDWLGMTIRDVKIQMAEAFLDLLAYPGPGSGGASMSAEPKCLGFALEVEEPPGTRHRVPDDEHYYSAECQTTLVRDQLDQLEALLEGRLAAGGPRLHRLELCVTIVRIVPREMLEAQYHRIADAPLSSHWARALSRFYTPRFQALVDEAVFFGDGRNRQRVLGEGACQLTESVAPGTAERGRTAQRRGR